MKKLTLFTSSIITLLLSFSLIFTACDKDPEPEPPITTPSITLGESSVVMGNISGSKSVTFKTNTDWSIKVDETKAPDWLTVAPMSGVAGDITLTVTAKQNETYDDRAAKVTITAGTALKTIEVSQKKLGALTLSKNEFMLPQEGGPIEIELTTNLDYSVTMSSWITQIQTKGLETHHLQFSVDPNDDYDDRTGEIVIKDNETGLSETIVVKQKKLGALTVTKDEYTIESKGGYIDIELATNIEYELTMSSWITQIQTKGLETHHLQFSVDPNDDYDRTGEIIIKDKYSDLYKTIVVKQKGTIELSILQLEREALMALYNSTNGPNWIDNTNWGSDNPVSEWFGITCDNDGRVTGINLCYNDLEGTIPPEIGTFQHLTSLYLSGEKIIGKIPEEIGNLKDLLVLEIFHTQISGNIPSSIFNCTKLSYLSLFRNQLSGPIPEGLSNLNLHYLGLYANNFTGTLPSDFHKLMDDEYMTIRIYGNKLVGPISDNVLNHHNWSKHAISITQQQTNYGFDLKSTPIYVPDAKFLLTDESDINLSDVYKNNKVTILLRWAEWCYFSYDFITNDLKSLYNSYHSKGLEILAYTDDNDTKEDIRKFVSTYNISWPTTTELISADWDILGFTDSFPQIIVLDNTGRVLLNCGDRYQLESLLLEYFGDPEDIELYKSTDYSKDGKVYTFQTATKGKGIDLVFMGDGFTDKDINSGLYDSYMHQAMESFFSIEPVKSHREYFNAYSVTAISQNDLYGYKGAKTAFDVIFGEGTHIEGNDTKCGEYALKTPVKKLDNTLIVVVTNNPRWSGTCYMYGDGSAIAYVTANRVSNMQLTLLVQHEAVGHGFAKLADEYTQNDGYIPTDVKASMQAESEQFGWWSNIDFTNDPGKVKWKHFIGHSKYSYVNTFEGAGLYTRGVWRPEYISGMDGQIEYFNAPSREAIYKKIMELAGETYSFNKFVSQDNVTPPIETRSTQESRPPTASPVVKGYSILD